MHANRRTARRSVTRVATIDIGTNTVLLLVAERDDDGALRAIAERATITRLGEGVDRTRRLTPAAVARTRDCLEEYAAVIGQLGAERVSIVGTSAMRDAAGGDDLRAQARALFGVDVRVLSGEQEARLAFRGAIGGLAFERGDHVAVFDIGGGSTEVVTGRLGPSGPLVDFAASYDVGSVRLTERYVLHDPPTADERDAMTGAARSAFAPVPGLRPSSVPVGIAGTMTTLAAVSLELDPYDGARVHGRVMTGDELRRAVDRITAVNLEARKRLRGMEPKRADVIVGGAMVALALLDHWGTPAVRISDRGVRWGLAEELASVDEVPVLP
jgi:exopolyphosphatase / guanosine-5'-triphosphate,3'-diphosphate pyrophosphatase